MAPPLGGRDPNHNGHAVAGSFVEHLVELVLMVDHEVTDTVNVVSVVDHGPAFHRMHEIQHCIRVELPHLRDLGQRRGIEMPDAGTVKHLQNRRMRIAFDRVEHSPGEAFHEPLGRRFEPLRAQAINRIARRQLPEHTFDVGKACTHRSNHQEWI